MIERNIKNIILKHSKKYPVLALIGPRQSGKTTLIKNIFPNKEYVNLEDIEIREFALNDPKGFLNQYKNGLIIDEVQRAPKLFSYIQVIVDEKKKSGMFILTGSQNFLLMKNISQSLAGRIVIFNLLPLSSLELSKQKSFNKKSIDEILYQGFYPKLYKQKTDIEFYYANYVQTYIERDVRLIKNIGNLSKFRKFLSLCAARTGQLLNVSSLANDCGITHHTASEWLSVLEASFIIYLLKPHHKNYNKRVVKMPKIYFYDTGLLCFLLGISNSNQLKSHYLRGGIFESFVILEFIKFMYNKGFQNKCYFWRDKIGNEIDLLLENSNRLIPVEIKSGQTITSDYFKGINYYNKISKNKENISYLIYGGKEMQKRTNIEVFGWTGLKDEKNNILNKIIKI